jgi:uridylate kinase
MSTWPYKRVLLKLSGEAFGSNGRIEAKKLNLILSELRVIIRKGVELALVIGAGNLWRKRTHGQGIDDVTADYMGLLATVMNGLALRDALNRAKIKSIVQSPVANNVPNVEQLDVVAARGALRRKQIVIFAGGTGKPFFTTDTAAAQRAVQVRADLIIKAGPVDGVYTADPNKYKRAKKYSELTMRQALQRRLQVMDKEAFAICEKSKILILVCRWQAGLMKRLITGKKVGTLVRA